MLGCVAGQGNQAHRVVPCSTTHATVDQSTPRGRRAGAGRRHSRRRPAPACNHPQPSTRRQRTSGGRSMPHSLAATSLINRWGMATRMPAPSPAARFNTQCSPFPTHSNRAGAAVDCCALQLAQQLLSSAAPCREESGEAGRRPGPGMQRALACARPRTSPALTGVCLAAACAAVRHAAKHLKSFRHRLTLGLLAELCKAGSGRRCSVRCTLSC